VLKNSILSVVVLVLAATPLLAVDETRQLDSRTFVKEGAQWTQIDPSGDRFDVDPRVITVKFQEGVDASAEDSLLSLLGGKVLRRARTGFVDIEITPGQDVFAAVDSYQASGLVEIVEPNTIGRYTVVPNDPSYASQWHHPIVDTPTAWDTSTGMPSAIIAVMDSGTEFSHDDLGLGSDGFQNIWLNSGEDAWSDPLDPTTGNGVDDDMNGLIDDWKGWDFANNNNDSEGTNFHGTAVAGMSAAKTNNGTSVAGIAGGFGSAGARVLIGAVGDAGPSGAALDDAVLYAVDNGANVVQMSLSVGTSAALDAAFQTAWDNNLTIICASGNGGTATVSYPSSNVNVMAVGSTTSGDLRSGFSQHGPLLEVSAPGSSVLTLTTGNSTTVTSGTSFAAPLTSGIVALMLGANPGLTNAEIRQILKDSADKVGGYDYNWSGAMPGHSQELGYGRVNVATAVAMAAAANVGFFEDGFESGDTTAWDSTVP